MSLFKSKTVTLYRAEPLGSPVVKKTKWNVNTNIHAPWGSKSVGKKTWATGTYFGKSPKVYFSGAIQIKKTKVPIKELHSVSDHIPYKYAKKAKLVLSKTLLYNLSRDMTTLSTKSRKELYRQDFFGRTKYKKINVRSLPYQSSVKNFKGVLKHPIVKKAIKKVAVRTALAASGVGTAAAVALTAHDIYSGSKWLYKKYKK